MNCLLGIEKFIIDGNTDKERRKQMALENLGKKLAQLGQDTKASVQKMSESYSLNSKIGEEKRALEQLFAQIGEAVFEKAGEEGIPGLEGLEEKFGAVKAAKEAIAGLEEQVQKLKGVPTCPECGKEAMKGEKFCSACGAKLPEVEEPVEQMKQTAKEVGGEVGDAVNEAADKARDFLGSVADKASAFMKGVSSRFAQSKDAEEDDEFDQDIVDLAEGAAKAAEDAVEEAADAAEEAAEDAAEEVAEAAEEIADAAEEAAEEAADAAEEAADGMTAEA